MSAYLVDRHHIAYLVHAAFSHQTGIASHLKHRLGVENETAAMIAMCNELTRENIASIEGKYPDVAGQPENAPGDQTAYEPWTAREIKGMIWMHIDPLQVLASCSCYEYQACEHDGWKTSLAKKLIESLVHATIRNIPGYDKAKWGAPPPYSGKVVRMI